MFHTIPNIFSWRLISIFMRLKPTLLEQKRPKSHRVMNAAISVSWEMEYAVFSLWNPSKGFKKHLNFQSFAFSVNLLVLGFIGSGSIDPCYPHSTGWEVEKSSLRWGSRFKNCHLAGKKPQRSSLHISIPGPVVLLCWNTRGTGSPPSWLPVNFRVHFKILCLFINLITSTAVPLWASLSLHPNLVAPVFCSASAGGNSEENQEERLRSALNSQQQLHCPFKN